MIRALFNSLVDTTRLELYLLECHLDRPMRIIMISASRVENEGEEFAMERRVRLRDDCCASAP